MQHLHYKVSRILHMGTCSYGKFQLQSLLVLEYPGYSRSPDISARQFFFPNISDPHELIFDF